jgi:hypothetical protein
MLYETRFLLSLLLTLIIEVPIIILLIRHVFKIKKLSLPKIIFVGIIASALTLPYLWFVFSLFIKSNYILYVGELLVFLFESFIYIGLLNIGIKRSLIISLVANLVSFSLGLLIIALI